MVADDACAGKYNIVIHIITFQRSQAACPAGDICVGDALCRDGGRRQLGHGDAIVKAAFAVPFEPVIQKDHLQNFFRKFFQKVFQA